MLPADTMPPMRSFLRFARLHACRSRHLPVALATDLDGVAEARVHLEDLALVSESVLLLEVEAHATASSDGEDLKCCGCPETGNVSGEVCLAIDSGRDDATDTTKANDHGRGERALGVLGNVVLGVGHHSWNIRLAASNREVRAEVADAVFLSVSGDEKTDEADRGAARDERGSHVCLVREQGHGEGEEGGEDVGCGREEEHGEDPDLEVGGIALDGAEVGLVWHGISTIGVDSVDDELLLLLAEELALVGEVDDEEEG